MWSCLVSGAISSFSPLFCHSGEYSTSNIIKTTMLCTGVNAILFCYILSSQDVDEEKVKERKRIAAERQRQLDALRVMNAAQLKEATRAQQEKLLAKIKERQTRIHAEIAAAAKEELKLLKVEARKAAGITDEDEDEEGETEPKLTDPDRGKGNDMDIEEMVAKEEAAAAVVLAGDGGSVDEEGDGDFVSITAAKPTVDSASRSSANRNVGDDDELEESASSDSDFEVIRETYYRDPGELACVSSVCPFSERCGSWFSLLPTTS